MAEPLDVLKLDPYQLGQRLVPIWDNLHGRIIRNLYKQVQARRAQPA